MNEPAVYIWNMDYKQDWMKVFEILCYKRILKIKQNYKCRSSLENRIYYRRGHIEHDWSNVIL